MKRILLSSILFLSSILGFGQDLYRFRHLMTSDGLPNNSISALFVDSHGLLWIGTESGLAWYDGYEVSSITQYDDGNGQTALGAVNGIMEDTTGNLLLNVGGRQMVYDRHSHTVSSMKEEGRKSFIDLHGQQWNIEVCSLSADDFHKKIAVPAGTFSSSSHIGLYRDKTESFWLYSFDDETLLRSSDGKNWQPLHLPNNNSNGNNAIRCLTDNDHGIVFIATDHQGLFCYHRTDGTVTQIQRTGNYPWEIASNNVSQVVVDKNGTLWLGHYKKGISYWNASFNGLTRRGSGLGDVSIMLADSKGTTWIGTDGNGLFRETVGGKTEQIDLPNVVVSSLMEDSRGRLWVGTYNSGIYRIASDRTEKLDKTHGHLISDNCWRMVDDGLGRVWISSGFGPLMMIDGETDACKEIKDKSGKVINGLSLSRDRKGRILVGTYLGLQVIDPKTMQVSNVLGTRDGKQFLSSMITSILCDSRGWVWLGHDVGLSVWNPMDDTVTYITMQDNGLSGNTIKSMVEDEQHRIWVTTSSGLSALTVKRADGKTELVVNNYEATDGIERYEFNANAGIARSDGFLLFGCADGYVVSNPQLLTSPDGLNRKVMFSQIVASGKLFGENDERITLNYDDYNVTLRLYTGNLLDAGKARYAWKLEGGSGDWVYTTHPTISFATLSPGHYTFRAKVQNDDGTWSEERILQIQVSPPLLLSWPMKALYALLLVGLMAGWFWRYRKRNQQKMEEERQWMAQEQAVRIADAKLQFFTNVSHDLRTPLTLIISPLQSLMKESMPESVKKRLQVIDKNAHNLMEQINTLLDFRKLDVGADTLNLRTDDYAGFVKGMVASFTPYADERHIRLDYNSDETQLFMKFDAEKVRKIMYNLLSNAFKFTCTDGRISVRLYRENEKVYVSVADFGQGVLNEDKERIFERFYQSKQRDDTKTGSGIGLHVVSEYVRMHGGRVWVSDNRPCGAVFTFFIPIVGKESQTVATSSATDENSEMPIDDGQYTVLVVEDNTDMNDFICSSLTDEYRVLTAFDGKEALQVMNQHSVNLIISDVMMPRMNGLELCKTIKTDLNLSHIPVILLTAKTAEASQLEGLQTGADDYLTKPFNVDVLKLRISKFIDWSKKAHQQFRQKIDVEPSEITITPLDEQFISKAIKIVEANLLDSDFSVETLGQELGLSRVALWRKLQAITGKAPGDFIRTIRVKRAKQLLEQSQMQVAEIAYTVGYNTPKRLSENFKAEFGITPSEYRKQIESNK